MHPMKAKQGSPAENMFPHLQGKDDTYKRFQTTSASPPQQQETQKCRLTSIVGPIPTFADRFNTDVAASTSVLSFEFWKSHPGGWFYTDLKPSGSPSHVLFDGIANLLQQTWLSCLVPASQRTPSSVCCAPAKHRSR